LAPVPPGDPDAGDRLTRRPARADLFGLGASPGGAV